MAKSKEARLKNEIFMYLAAIMAVCLLAISGLAFWAHNFVSDMVSSELAAQKIYFPKKGSPSLDPAKYPDLQKYAGQLVDTPEEAKAYANGYIGRHLHDIAGGKSYAEVSAAAAKDPDNQKLQQQKQSLFQGETLRGILLTSGYGMGLVGKVAGVAAVVTATLGVTLLAAAGVLRARK